MVVCPTGKYCNVLLYPLSAHCCTVLSAIAMFQLLSHQSSSTAMQHTFSCCNTTECNLVPLQHSCLPPLQCKLVSPCNTLIPHCNTAQLSLIAICLLLQWSIHCNTLIPCSATQLLSVAMVCPLQWSHFAIYLSAIATLSSPVVQCNSFPLQCSLIDISHYNAMQLCPPRWCVVQSSEGRGQRQPTTNTKVTVIMRDMGPQNYGEFNEPLFCNKAVLWAVDKNGWALLACRSVWMQWKGGSKTLLEPREMAEVMAWLG